MTDLRDRYDRFAAAFGAEARRVTRAAAARRGAAGQDQYWKSVHDLFTRDVTEQGLRDLVEAAQLTGALPEIDLVTVSIAEIRPMELTLSPAVQASLPRVRAAVRAALARHTTQVPGHA